MTELVPKPESLKLSGNVGENFRRFRREISAYFQATEFSKKSTDVQVAAMVRLIGDDARRVYDQIEKDVAQKSVASVMDALEERCLASTNEVRNQMTFFQRHQTAGESFEQYYADLERLIRGCHFEDAEKTLMRTQIVMGIRNGTIQRELVVRNLNLEDTLKYCRESDVSGNGDEREPDEASSTCEALRSSYVQRHNNKRIKDSVERMSLDLASIRLAGQIGPGSLTREYTMQLAADKTTSFSKHIKNFVSCTIASNETNVAVVMQNVRQFMTGMKNYLLRQGEGDFLKVVATEHKQSMYAECLNLDTILEGVISWLVLTELRGHIHRLLVDEFIASGSMSQLKESIRYAKCFQHFTFRGDLRQPDESDLRKISDCFKRLENAVLPFEKLEHLTSAITMILNAVQPHNNNLGAEARQIEADEFLSLIIWSVVECDARSIELDVAYMIGLLHPSLTSGEPGCYLTAVKVAMQMLKWQQSFTARGSITAVPPIRVGQYPSTREEYALRLVADKTTVFAQSVENFVYFTIESKETRSSVVMRNVRQFMSGMKNYLINYCEKEFQEMAERERSQMTCAELPTLDKILESVMNRLVLVELRDHIYSLLVNENVTNGSIPAMVENIRNAKSKSVQEFSARENLMTPDENDLKKISECFRRLRVAFMPSEKLEHLLSAVSAIRNAVESRNEKVGISNNCGITADDFLPLMEWVLVQCDFVTAGIETEYINGLHPLLTIGEGAYYLTTFHAIVHVLKGREAEVDRVDVAKSKASLDTLSYDPLNELKYVLKVVVLDKTNGLPLWTKAFAVRPNTTTRDVCKIIAQKLHITNSANYSLYGLVDGREFLLSETDRPQDIKSSTTARGTHCLFVYKRVVEK